MNTVFATGNCQLVCRLVTALAVAVVLCAPATAQSEYDSQPSTSSPTMIYEGFTQPRHDIMVAATEIGRLDTVTVEVGDLVTAGQLLGRLEDALQASSVRIAQLQVEMTGELEAAKAEAELHRVRAETLRKLAADGMARPDELIRAETDYRIAAAKLLAASEQLQLRKLELERYQLQLQRREIRAPMDGVISQLFHKPGEYITPGDPAVVRLIVMDTLEAVFNIPVEDLAKIAVGTPVHVYLRSSSKTIDAEITAISPDIDGESGTVQVRVELDNSDGRLRSGDRCTLRPGAPRRAVSAKRTPHRLPPGRSTRR